ncbi:MAG: 50S ribosomal protein L18e [Desulfurococcales archaeon]|nr:50S ribosomal protein L18e [Desulfurococcales archaeon]
MKRTGPTNYELRKLARTLRKYGRIYKAGVWFRVSELLLRPTRRRVAVNLSKINRYAREGEVVIVPGKVLGAGKLEKKVTIAAYAFSLTALNKIKEAGGRAITIQQLIRENPSGRNTRIII